MPDDDLPENTAPANCRVTIRDVARQTGVSVTTASRALNEIGRMTPETRNRVRAAAAELGYRPNSIARGLVGKRSFAVGLITNDTYGRFTLPVAAGLSSSMADRGVSVFLCAGEDDAERVKANIDAMQDRRVDGLVIAGKRIDRGLPFELPDLGIPVIYANASCPPDAIGFVPDDQLNAHMAVSHLVARGCCRIAHVTGKKDFEASSLRVRGWEEALAEANLSPFGDVCYGNWSEECGYTAALELLAPGRAEWPDAVFCGNDQIARGLIDAATSIGVDVPGDLAVVGFDNWEIFAKATRPPLTTVDMELLELGRVVGRTMLDLIDGKDVEPGLRRLPGRIVERRSCGGGGADLEPRTNETSRHGGGNQREDTKCHTTG
ncbi:LacI family DNA-binding transcriptional regulator [Roseisalinus antarcticus]|uniref:Catabolite control protein A n=1 Tax=Roseisalinus antarcticus TaxID=254357 RepID=A0A1Y5U2D9_9RHOB|nr:LacI family DNA-binding transcriptional regulator [Roseisalinus antarcticus]SLN76982.1 Catabolite control protein A [Roseisalinus antarcticus]